MAFASEVQHPQLENQPSATVVDAPVLEAPKPMLTKVGPWGQLEYFEVMLEAPAELIQAHQPPSIRTRWFFGKTKSDEVVELIQKLNLPNGLAEKLTDKNRWLETDGDVTIFPKVEDLENIPPEARATLYKTLSKWQENNYHVEPEILYGATPEEAFKEFNISPAILKFVSKTSYSYGTTILFADTPAILSLAESDDERLRILRALSRTPSLFAKLILKAAQPEALTEYWKKGFRFKDTSTLLASMQLYNGTFKVDIVHLLPANIRKILYTFPDPTLSRSGYLPDCHWSSLNFFNNEPLERLSDPVQATAYTLENFSKVAPPYELGDVIFFTDTQTGDAYHSCVYIADDIVFTKNGRSPIQPWILMKMEQVKAVYDVHFQTNVSAYRRKGLAK